MPTTRPRRSRLDPITEHAVRGAIFGLALGLIYALGPSGYGMQTSLAGGFAGGVIGGALWGLLLRLKRRASAPGS